jgi:hypothetical protein
MADLDFEIFDCDNHLHRAKDALDLPFSQAR